MTAAASAVLLLLACGEPAPETSLTRQQLEDMAASLEGPAVVLLWAEWSRPAVELLPAAGELAAEYEGGGVTMITACLGDAPTPDARRLLDAFPATARHVRLSDEPPFVLAHYGLGDVPAVLLYSPAGELLLTLEGSEHAPLTPAELADAIESVLGAS